MNLKTDINGDIAIEERNLVLLRGQEEIEQHVAQRLKTFLAEWFLDTLLGVPYFEQILKKQINISAVQSLLINEIIETPGVTRLLEFNLDLEPSTRVLNLTFRAETTDGVIDFSEDIA